jgi:signal transduction histidine kinase/HAMP domain-containing protein
MDESANTPPAVKSNSEIRNAFRATSIYALAAAIAFLIEIYLAIGSHQWQTFAIAGIGGFVTGGAALSVHLTRRGQPKLAVQLLIAMSLLSVLVAPTLIAGFGLILGLGMVLVVLAIAPQVLPAREVNWALMASVTVAVMAGGLDLLAPASQLTFPVVQNLILATGGIMILAYSIITVRQFSSYTLPTKLIVAFLMVSLVPLGLLAFLNDNHTRAALVDDANRVLFAAASQTATSIDTFITTNRNAVNTEAQLPVFINYLSLLADQRPGSVAEAEVKATLQEFSRKDKIFIESYALLDSQGIKLVDTDEVGIGQNLSDLDYFRRPVTTGLGYVSPVQFIEVDQDPFLYFSSPVRNEAKEVIGVLRVRYKAAILQQLVVKNNGLFGEQSFGILLDENHIRLAHGNAPQLVFQSIVPLDPDKLAELQGSRRLPVGAEIEFATNLPDFEAGLLSATEGKPYFTTQLATIGRGLNSAAVAKLKGQSWLVVFVQPQDVFLAPIQTQTRNVLFLAVAIAGVIVVVAFAVGQLLAAPLVHLTNTVAQFTAGDLSARTNIQTADETGLLAASFNKMAEQVGKLLTGLEERTHELELSQDVIFAVSELSKASLDMELLLSETVSLLRTRFNLYHVLVLLVDEEKKALIFRAGSGEVTKKLQHESFAIPLDREKSVMAFAARTQEVVVVDDARVEPNFMEHPLLPQTLSEVAIPLVSRDTLLGVLDLQDNQLFRFSQADIDTFVTLAGYLVTALENAYLFEQIQEAKEAAESANRAKSVFLTTMSHEFRTPLNAIIGYSEMLEEDAEDMGQEVIIPDLQKIQTASKHLLALINDVLDLSKIEADKMKLYLETFDITSFVEQVTTTVQPMIKKKDNILQVDVTDDIGMMYADPVRVRQVLFNLLSNAAKFTQQGTITLEVTRHPSSSLNGEKQLDDDTDWIGFSVTDTGIGMAREQIAGVFRAFIQADTSTTRKYEGTGLGLAISQRLCHMMGGHIIVESELEQGSTFVVHLPAVVVGDETEQLVEEMASS